MATPINPRSNVPPRPASPPSAGRRDPLAKDDATHIDKSRTRHRTRHGMTISPTLNINRRGGGQAGASGAGPGVGASAGQTGQGGVPGSDFMSNEDIQKFCEYLRKDARTRSMERAMDADHLEAVLRTIPDSMGGMGGSRARARRVARWLKKIAAAEKAIQKYSASVYASFEREYEAELRKIGRARDQQQRRRHRNFNWTS